jgi:hypothetical protein
MVISYNGVMVRERIRTLEILWPFLFQEPSRPGSGPDQPSGGARVPPVARRDVPCDG